MLGFALVLQGFSRARIIGEPPESGRAEGSTIRIHDHPAAPDEGAFFNTVPSYILPISEGWTGEGGELDRTELLDIQQIGDELAVKWDDGAESFVALQKLRRHCPCAGCKGEVDIMGNLYKNPERPSSAEAFRLVQLDRVGGYAIQPVWGDGHASGIYSYEYLRRMGCET